MSFILFLRVKSAISFPWEDLEGRFVSCQHSLACSAANGGTACWAACLSSASNMCEGLCWGGWFSPPSVFVFGLIHVGSFFNISLIFFTQDRCVFVDVIVVLLVVMLDWSQIPVGSDSGSDQLQFHSDLKQTPFICKKIRSLKRVKTCTTACLGAGGSSARH